jgi:hypothetical protein
MRRLVGELAFARSAQVCLRLERSDGRVTNLNLFIHAATYASWYSIIFPLVRASILHAAVLAYSLAADLTGADPRTP